VRERSGEEGGEWRCQLMEVGRALEKMEWSGVGARFTWVGWAMFMQKQGRSNYH
jgi:hypothetical protein